MDSSVSKPPGLDLLASGFNDLAGFGFFVGFGFRDGPILLGGILLVAAPLFAFGDVGIGILLFDLHLGALGELVREDAFALGDLGDLLDALGVQHVAGIVLIQRRLLEIIDRHVLQQKPVQILPDGHLDLIAKLGPLREQLVELHLFARGLERLGELGLEQFPQLVEIRHPLRRQHLRHFPHAFHRGIHPDVKRHRDVRADVVLADQAVLALALDLEFLHRDVHDVVRLHQRHPDHPIERNLDPAPAGLHPRPAGLNLANAEYGDQPRRQQDQHHQHDQERLHRFSGER